MYIRDGQSQCAYLVTTVVLQTDGAFTWLTARAAKSIIFACVTIFNWRWKSDVDTINQQILPLQSVLLRAIFRNRVTESPYCILD